jgi:hypothetical protein
MLTHLGTLTDAYKCKRNSTSHVILVLRHLSNPQKRVQVIHTEGRTEAKMADVLGLALVPYCTNCSRQSWQ